MRQFYRDLLTDERREHGYVIVLPGVEGRSWWNRSIVRGLVAAKIPYAMEIYDWTWRWPFFAVNMRSEWLHVRQAKIVADKIQLYQNEFPDRPVYLVGHSGGGALALLALARLPADSTITGTALLGAAISPDFNLCGVLDKVTRGIWSFSSPGDCFFLGLMTCCGGTFDGKFSPCAGMTGFRGVQLEQRQAGRFQEIRFRRQDIRWRNFGGHFGYTTKPFVRECVAPLMLPEEAPVERAAQRAIHAR